MIATEDRSRIRRQSSKPSISGSIRSSSTMSGDSVSSSRSARSPSADTTLSKPRTARLDLIRSTMFGSSSTTSARVFLVFSVMAAQSLPGFLGLARQSHGFAAEAVPVPVVGAGTVAGLHRQADAEARAAGRAAQFDAAAVRLDDGLGDGQPEPGPGAGGAALRSDV